MATKICGALGPVPCDGSVALLLETCLPYAHIRLSVAYIGPNLVENREA